MEITDIDARIARSHSVFSNTYKYVENTYMPKIYDSIKRAAMNGQCVISVNMFKLLKFKYWKFCPTFLTVIYDHLIKRGFTMNIKRNKIVIDWINPNDNAIKNDIESQKSEDEDDDKNDSSTGAPRVLESDNENDEEAIFTPKSLKRHIGFNR